MSRMKLKKRTKKMAKSNTEEIKQLPSEYYSKEESNRMPYEYRAETLAKFTIPALMRDRSWTASSTTPDDYDQSFGARCVKNLASKVGTSLFPPNSSAFRFTPNAELLSDAQADDKNNELNKAIVTNQNDVTAHLEALNTRNTIYNVLEHLIVVSSVVLEKIPKKGYKVHTLRNFVVSLDDAGNEFKLCVKEVLRKTPDGYVPKEDKDEYELYTMLEFDDDIDKWVMTQEIDGELFGEEKTFTDDNRPFAYQGWMWTQGDYYHRPYCDDYEGDFKAVNTLAKVLTKGAMISSKNITLVDERGGRTRLRDIRKAKNGDIVQGRADDVTSYQHGKNYDYQTALDVQNQLKRELSLSFLLQEGLRRDAERVTAEEMRMVAREAEQALASVYAVISNKLIRRMVIWAMNDLNMSMDEMRVDIVTGVDALGRQAQAMNMDEYLSRGANLGFLDRVKQDTLATLYASYYNIDTENLLMTDEEYAQKQQAQQQALAQQQLGENVSKGIGQQVGKA